MQKHKTLLLTHTHEAPPHTPPDTQETKYKQIKRCRQAEKSWIQTFFSLSITFSASLSEFCNIYTCNFDLFCLSPHENIDSFILNWRKTEPESQEVVWLLIFSFQQLCLNHPDPKKICNSMVWNNPSCLLICTSCQLRHFLPLAKWKAQTLCWHFIFCQSNELKRWRRVVAVNSLWSSTHAAKSSCKLRVCYLTCRGPGSGGGAPLLPLLPLSSCQLPVELLWLSRWQEVLIFDRVLKNSHPTE